MNILLSWQKKKKKKKKKKKNFYLFDPTMK